MYVTRLDADNWTSGSQQDEVTEHPELAQIEQALRLLDGERHTLVVLGANETTYMGVGGGAEGRFVVFINYADEEFYSLKNADPTVPEDEAYMLTIGGRRDEYLARQCVGREEMLRAALCFAVDGSREPSLTWERQEEDEDGEEWVLHDTAPDAPDDED
jgi:hypothetical protein